MMINEDDLRKLVRYKIINEKRLQLTFNQNFDLLRDGLFKWANDYLGTGTVSDGKGGSKTVVVLNPSSINVKEIYNKRIEGMDNTGNVDKDTVLLLPKLGKLAQRTSPNTNNTKSAFDQDFKLMEEKYLAMTGLSLNHSSIESLLPTLKTILTNLRISMSKVDVDNILNHYESSGSLTDDQRERGELPPEVDGFLRDLRKAVKNQLKGRLKGTMSDPGVITDLQAMLKDGLVDQSQIEKIIEFANNIN